MSPVTYALSGLMVLIGVAMVMVTLVRGGGPLATGLVAGILFVAAGAGRIYAEKRRS